MTGIALSTVSLLVVTLVSCGTATFAADLASTAAPAASNCTLVQFADLPFETSAEGMALVPVNLNGQPRTLLLDTGAGASVISAGTANALGMRQNYFLGGMMMFGGAWLNKFAVADSFTIGTMHASRFPLIVSPSRLLPPSLDGMLGADVLHNYDVEVDFVRARFKIFSPDHCPDHVVYWARSNYARIPITLDAAYHITVPVVLDGKAVTAVFDTGAETSVMSLEQAKTLFGIVATDTRVKARTPTGINGLAKSPNYTFPFESLTLDGIAVRNPDILLLPEKNMGHGVPQLLLGISILRQLHLYIGYREKALYATAAEAQ